MRMISKNIVLIETIDSSGTGFLYPCKYEEDFSSQYFIIFTNSHVLKDIGLEQEGRESSRNYKDQIILSFYDSLGNKVSQKDIKEIKVYNSGNFMRSEEDIAALLIAVRNVVPMTLTNRVCHRQLDNREKLYIEGYPGVLREDEVCGKIQLEGIEKKYIEEVSNKNIFFVINNEIVTPKLNGSIKPGIMRQTMIELANNLGYQVSEKEIAIEDIVLANDKGILTEVFCTDTLKAITPVNRISHLNNEIILNSNQSSRITQQLYKAYKDIQTGKAEDIFNWTLDVKQLNEVEV